MKTTHTLQVNSTQKS